MAGGLVDRQSTSCCWLPRARWIFSTQHEVTPDTHIPAHTSQPKYVCRAGLKLEAALEHWGIDVHGKTALDSGLSTGGFTDCLLQVGLLAGLNVAALRLLD